MNGMLSVKMIRDRFGRILSELDALADTCKGELAEDLEDMNAELEDALLLISEIRPEADDWREELTDALEALRALASDYRGLADTLPQITQYAARLEAVADEAMAEE